MNGKNGWEVPGVAVQPPRQKSRPPVYSNYILEGRWDEGGQPAKKKLLGDFAEKYALQEQGCQKKRKMKVGMESLSRQGIFPAC